MNIGKAEEDLLTCQICMLSFDLESQNTRPHLLVTCGHTFCLSCLKTCIIPSKSCPICRTPHNILTTDISLFGSGVCRNFTLEGIIECRKQSARQQLPQGAKPTDSQQRPSEQDPNQFYCIQCLQDFEMVPTAEGILQHAHVNHSFIGMSTVDPNLAKQMRWLFNLAKNKDFGFLRSKIMIYSLQSQTKSIIDILERVEKHFQIEGVLSSGGNTNSIEEKGEELKNDIARMFVGGQHYSDDVEHPELISDLCELWKFEVRSAFPFAWLMSQSSTELALHYNESIISELKKDWHQKSPCGLHQKWLTLLEMACASMSGFDAERKEIFNFWELIKTQSSRSSLNKSYDPSLKKPKGMNPGKNWLEMAPKKPDRKRPIARNLPKLGPLTEDEQEPTVIGNIFYQDADEEVPNSEYVNMPKENILLPQYQPDRTESNQRLGKRNIIDLDGLERT